jgi:hydrogenase/urease accessory protein HupE
MLRESVRRLASLAALLTTLACATPASAHPLAPALLQLRELPDGKTEVTWKTSVVRVRGARVEPILPEGCRGAGEPTVKQEGDGLIQRWTIVCGEGGLVGRVVGVSGLGTGRSDALLRVALADGRVVQRVLRADEPTFEITAGDRPTSVFGGYLRLGFDHILGGVDHLLFVFGLLLLASSTRLLIETITAFTVGHSITLSLAALGIANVPSAAVDVLIAISIFVLAVELARGKNAPPTLLRRFPWLMAFLFGLLHGLGFAGALREIGLPEGDIPMALLSFNVGIELGQLAFVFAILSGGVLLRRILVRLPGWAERVPVYAIGCLSAYWVLDRISTWLR